MSSTLREYLISLGFKVDESSFKRFKEGTAKSAAAVTELGAEAVASAAAIETAVVRVARRYEDLYYSAQRSGSTVANLKAFAYGGRQIGLSYEQARSSVEGFASALRTNPGLKGLLRQIGIDPNEDPTLGVIHLVEKMKAMFGDSDVGRAAATRLVSKYGLDDATFASYWENVEDLKKSYNDYQEMLKNAGLNTKEASEQFRDFDRSLEKLTNSFQILGERIAFSFLKPTKEAVDALEKLTEKAAKFNDDHGGAPGVVTTAAGTAGSAWLGKRIWSKITGRSAGGDVLQNIEREAAEEALPAARGLLLRRALSFLGPIGALLGMTEDTADKSDDDLLSKEYRAKHGAAAKTPASTPASGTDRDLITRTVIGEAADQGAVGQAAVAAVIMNRLRSGKFGKSVSDVLFAPKQFEPWATRRDQLMAISPDSAQYKKVAAIVDAIMSGEIADPTNGATHFANVGIVRARGNAAAMRWIASMIGNGSAVQIGEHLFGTPDAGAPGTGRRLLADRLGMPPAASAFEDRFNGAYAAPPDQSSRSVTVNMENHFNISSADPRLAAKEVLDAQGRIQGDIVRNSMGALR